MIAFKIAIVLMVAALVSGGYVRLPSHGGTSRQTRHQDEHGYQFGYDIEDPQGARNGRWEIGDKWGNKKGSYYIQDIDGRIRRVDYVADGLGFRAKINTNEPGTQSSITGSAIYNSAHGGNQLIGRIRQDDGLGIYL